MSYQNYYDFLFARAPHYDKMILRDVSVDVFPVIKDVRLLPTHARKMVRLHRFLGASMRSLSKLFGIPYSTLRSRLRKYEDLLDKRFNSWISSLTKPQLKREWAVRQDIWIGKVYDGPFDSFKGMDHAWERLSVSAPDLLPSWQPTKTTTSQ